MSHSGGIFFSYKGGMRSISLGEMSHLGGMSHLIKTTPKLHILSCRLCSKDYNTLLL